MHPKVLSARAWRAVRKLTASEQFKGWTVAGGTGLALQIGHRYSDDLGLFRPEEFDPERLLKHLSKFGSLLVQNRDRSTLHAVFEGLRLSFLQVDPPLLFPGIRYRGLSIADPRDIAVMKLVAIGGRGSKKDFIDLYFCLKGIGNLDTFFSMLQRRFSRIDYNEYHLLKSLVYFEDADNEPLPRLIRPLSWEEIKTEIVSEVRRFTGSA